MAIRCLAVMAGLIALLVQPALAKPAQHGHHVSHRAASRHADVRYAQAYYDYRSASTVREEFADGGRWRDEGRFARREFFRDRQEGRVVENLRGDFTGGVGYGANGDVPAFVDGYGQTHFFVGSFRQNAPAGRFGAPRFGRGFGRHF